MERHSTASISRLDSSLDCLPGEECLPSSSSSSLFVVLLLSSRAFAIRFWVSGRARLSYISRLGLVRAHRKSLPKREERCLPLPGSIPLSPIHYSIKLEKFLQNRSCLPFSCILIQKEDLSAPPLASRSLSRNARKKQASSRSHSRESISARDGKRDALHYPPFWTLHTITSPVML